MSQNVYDVPEFFAGYNALSRSQEGINGALEWPILRDLIGDVQGHRILDLGCGFGWFCRWAQENGAQTIRGIDISKNMLEKAKGLTSHTAITYSIGDLETIKLKDGPYDLVYSSLAFHYLTNLKELFVKVFNSLEAGGHFVFSVEHPIFTAPIVAPAWKTDGNGAVSWGVDSYAEEGPRHRDWLMKGVVKQHRTIDTYVSLLLSTGFILSAVKEWMPSKEYIRDHSSWERERHRPLFLVLGARKPEEINVKS